MEIQLLRTDHCVSEIISKYADLVFRLCIVYLKNKADAEDAFQVMAKYILRVLQNLTKIILKLLWDNE